MKKLFNFRLPFVSFVAVILGVIVARLILCFDKLEILFPVIILILASNFLVLCITLGRAHANIIIYVCMAFTMFVMAVCSGLSHFSYINKDLDFIENGSYTISGEISKVDYDSNAVYLKNIYIEELNITSNGSAKVYLLDNVNKSIVRGDSIRLTASVYVNDINDFIAADNQTITAYHLSRDGVEFFESSSLKSKFKRSVYSKLIETSLSADTAEIEFAMLFGDKDRLGDSTRNAYSVTGLAHILAVSGLHVGLVVSAIFFFTKRLLKNKHLISLLITLAVTMLYLYLCDFAISAVRAVLMTAVIYYAKARGKLYDGLCGISFAGIIILLVNPFDLFDVGFELSFVVVFSLFALSPPITRFLKRYLPVKIASSLSVCCSTFVGSSLIISYYFNSCSILAILSNFIIIPIVSISFTMLFIGVLIVSIVPYFKFLLVVPNLLFELINILVGSIANMKFSAILFSTNIIGVVLGLFAIFVISDYVFLSRKQKAVIAGIIACFIGMTVVSEVYDILENRV